MQRRTLLAVATVVILLAARAWLPPPEAEPTAQPASAADAGRQVLPDLPEADPVAHAYAAKARDIFLTVDATVDKLLRDDDNGDRHQRFLIRSPDGIRVLVAHNIDIAPRVPDLEAGQPIRLRGEYIWNDKGGILHWTHHAPRGDHAEGWIEYGGRRYR
ncbi:MAG: DUF3465 domain-containing protein [Pseudomonadales bacterium]|nr:DUF3465 domain-containing protein [Pseudomonadales bacterium]